MAGQDFVAFTCRCGFARVDDWNDRPLAALRKSLYRATATVAAEQLAPSMRLSDILGDLGQRLNVHLIVLLDRFEDLLLAPTPGAGHRQFANELAEAVNERPTS